MNNLNKIIGLDFDGVIHRYNKGWYNGEIYDIPVEGAIEAMQELTNIGYKLIIITARPNKDDILPWLKKYGFNEDIEITNEKIPARIYIDDRGLRFTHWKDILNYFI